MPASSTIDHFKPERYWGLLALLAITLSGLAPIILLAGRASVYADMALVKQWFTPILVLHVNLSVGLWFLAMTMMLWCSRISIPAAWRIVHHAAVISFLGAILCMAAAPLAGGEAYTSNYIPVQDNPPFFIGLGLVLSSLLLMIALTLCLGKETLSQLQALTLLAAIGCFIFSVIQHPSGYGGEGFYESVFWAGGHVMQLVYVQTGMLAWMVLADRLELPTPPVKHLFVLLWLNAAIAPLIYWFVEVNSYYHLVFFTGQMIAITGIIPGMLALWYLIHLPKMNWRLHPAAAGCFIMSLLLFLYGGAIGYLIEGSNVTIPAHYHGSTVGITLALMGLFYVMMEIPRGRLATTQPWIYGIGQIMHVTGLALAGGYNIARKTAGSLDSVDQAAAAALQVMRLGGVVAVLGGGLFVVVALLALKAKRKAH